MTESELPVVQEQFLMADFCDDEQIVAEILGRVLETYIYEFLGPDGHLVRGLSKTGTDWACRKMALAGEAVRVKTPQMFVDPTDPEYVIATIEAQRWGVQKTEKGAVETPLDSAIGVKRQWIFREIKTCRCERRCDCARKKVRDQFFAEKAISKASRNARQSLLPKDLLAEMIAEAAKKKDQVKRLGPSTASEAAGMPKGKPAPKKPAEPKPTPEAPKEAPKAAPSASPPREHPATGHETEKPQPKPTTGDPAKRELIRKRQTLYALLKGQQLSDEGCKKALKDLTGAASSKDLTEQKLDDLIAALKGVGTGENTMVLVEGKYAIVPKASEPAAGPTAEPLEEAGAEGEEDLF